MSKVAHSFRNDVLADHDAVELARLIRDGHVSSAEVTETAIERARSAQPALHAIQHELFSEATEASSHVPPGVFAGVPMFVKDTMDLRGAPTRIGSRAIGARPAKADADFTKLLRAQGVTILGKTTLPELGFNATTEPEGGVPTRNPWNVDYTPGGSSGGSAALVAAGVVPLAHGNDGGGSLRIPAACCGLFALKPSRGRLPTMESARQLPIDIVCEGIITRSVRDTAHFYAAAEQTFRARKLPVVGLVEGPAKARLRVGMVLDSVAATSDAETRACIIQAATLLEDLGHSVTELRMPKEVASFPRDFSLYWAMIAFLSKTFGKLSISSDFDPTQLEGLTLGLAALYKKNLLQTPGVLLRLRRSAGQYARVMSDYDVLLSPVTAHTTPKLGYLYPGGDFDELFERLHRFACFTPLNNATGSPAMTVPLGTSANGLPLGVHFSARRGAERTLLELAYELEQARPWRRIQDAPLA